MKFTAEKAERDMTALMTTIQRVRSAAAEDGLDALPRANYHATTTMLEEMLRRIDKMLTDKTDTGSMNVDEYFKMVLLVNRVEPWLHVAMQTIVEYDDFPQTVPAEVVARGFALCQ